jgi:hypothetical protein
MATDPNINPGMATPMVPPMSGQTPPPPGPVPAPALDPEPEHDDEPKANTYLPDGTPLDTNVITAMVKGPDGVEREMTAAATDPNAPKPVLTGLAAAPNVGREMGADAVTRVLMPEPEKAPMSLPDLVGRWVDSMLHKRFGPSIARGPQDLGLVGQGHVVQGHQLLMDADTGEVVRAMPGAKITEDKLYVNTRNLPEWLVNDPDLATGGQHRP